jgi:hypothetical protein
MLNTEHSYYEAGFKAGRARTRGDEGLARHWSSWFRQAQMLERDADRSEARRLFDQGYREARGI